jgi:hypothetical protein
MKTVSSRFLETVKGDSKQFRAIIHDGDGSISDADDLKRVKVNTEGEFLRTVMKQVEFDYFGVHPFLDRYVGVSIGVDLPKKLSKGTVTITIASPAVLTRVAHGLNTGDRITIETTGDLPTGLLEGTYYYVVRLTDDTFGLSSTYENAVATVPVRINTSGTQSGTHTLFSYPVGEFDDPEYVDYGNFRVIEIREDLDKEYSTAKGYDRMYETMKRYRSMRMEYPTTLGGFVGALCEDLGFTLGTTSFFNDDLVIEGDPFVFGNYSYRQILEQVAEVSASVIYFNEEDKLIIRGYDDTVQEALTTSEQRALKLESLWGEVNSVVISRDPERTFAYDGGYEGLARVTQNEDTRTTQDTDTRAVQAIIEVDGLYQIRINDNLFLGILNYDQATAIRGEITGFAFYPFEVKTIGLGFFEVGDGITVQDRDENTYETFIFGHEIEVGESSNERIFARVLEKSRTNYKDKAEYIQDVVRTSEISEQNIRDGSVTDAKVSNLSASKITTGTLTAEQAITIRDHVTGKDIILIGYQEDGF